MLRGLQQGMLGIGQGSLAPSLTALGPNRYLREKDFFTMLGMAFFAHLVVLVVASLLPSQKVTDIPVRALSFKIGGQDRMAALGAPRAVPTPPAAAPVALNPTTWRAAPLQPAPVTPPPLQPIKPASKIPKVIPIPVKPVKIAPPQERTMPEENRAAAPLVPLPSPPPEPPAATPTQAPPLLPSTEILTQVATPAIADNPQRFIREVGAAPLGAADGTARGEGSVSTSTNGSAESARVRYEQQISAWIGQHKLYPTSAGGVKGKVVVRMRIDRAGYVRYYAVEQSSGNALLDAAAIDMIRRANPVPAVPADYPAGNLIEFVIPVNFAP